MTRSPSASTSLWRALTAESADRKSAARSRLPSSLMSFLPSAARFSAETLDHPAQARRERVDLAFGVVEGERGPRGGGNPEPVHHRHRAMVAGAHGDAVEVQERADVV